MVYFSLEELKDLSELDLINLFSKSYWNEKMGKHYFECLLLPDQCQLMTASENESIARRRLGNHMSKHLKTLDKNLHENFRFHPVDFKAAKKLKRIDQEIPEVSKSQTETVVKRRSNIYTLWINCIEFEIDTKKMEIFASGVQCPVSFEVEKHGYISNVMWQDGPELSIENELDPTEDLSSSLYKRMKEDNITAEHDYCAHRRKAKEFQEIMKAIYVYNHWVAEQDRINSGVNNLLEFNREYLNAIPISTQEKLNSLGTFVGNEAEDFLIQGEVVDNRQQPIVMLPEGPKRRRKAKALPNIFPKPQLVTEPKEFTGEKEKREIALAALAELGTEFRRHRLRKISIKDGTIETPSQTRKVPENRTCKICKLTFTARGSLRAHYRSHAGVKPFNCNICGAKFTRRHSLNYHLLCHSGEMKYTCPWCPKVFRHAGHFKDHIRQHQCEPFLCPVCGFKFSNRTTLRRHLKLSHNKESLKDVTGDEETTTAVVALYSEQNERTESPAVRVEEIPDTNPTEKGGHGLPRSHEDIPGTSSFCFGSVQTQGRCNIHPMKGAVIQLPQKQPSDFPDELLEYFAKPPPKPVSVLHFTSDEIRDEDLSGCNLVVVPDAEGICAEQRDIL